MRSRVNSGTIRSVGYDFSKQELELVFVSGKVYAYNHVPVKIVHELVNADSIGEYFNHHIRDHFEYAEKTNLEGLH